MNMGRYLVIAKSSFMTRVARRSTFIFTFLGNLAYITVIYYLWMAVYEGNAMLNGMTFNQAFAYLALASSLFTMFQVYTEWFMSAHILNGDIITSFIKPLDYQFNKLFEAFGAVISNFITISIPTLLVIIFVFDTKIEVGLNLAFFVISLLMAMLISFFIDYMIGLCSFYTESIWGICTTKDVIVLFLSGAMVPISFFPEYLQTICAYLPFQAIYNIPLTIVTTPGLSLMDYANALAMQGMWVVILLLVSRLLHAVATRTITVNGG
ncbi:ABC transporter permease [Paenibacillus aquistagni]|uniref:ABC transporter permease n=1 Tax=Paenibacillus aquistagni TaxID=1852522 RepID=UPI00145AB57B|nr:ABC-2 family transporter protein [Paenibacillus aquistagni]NMM53375.1 hypothetical protein [Paenibacillus aquistagni]